MAKDTDTSENKQAFWETNFGTMLIWLIAIVICLLLWIGGAYITHCYAIHHFSVGAEENAPALFGDSFGAVNALISAFAFAGMIVTFFLQRRELHYQREDLQDQRDEFKAQNATLKLQRFESTFFNMMNLQQQIVNELSIDYVNIEQSFRGSEGFVKDKKHLSHRGRKVFEVIYRGDIQDEGGIKGIRETIQEEGLAEYDDMYSVTTLDHYFLYLQNILEYIDASTEIFLSLGEKNVEMEKMKYASALRATLSRYELVMLFYHCLSPNNVRLKSLVEKYHLMSNLNRYLLTLSHDTKKVICKEVGLSETIDTADMIKKLQLYGLSGRDYEFYLSPVTEEGKYSISAFAQTDEEIERLKGFGRLRYESVDSWKHEIETKADS